MISQRKKMPAIAAKAIHTGRRDSFISNAKAHPRKVTSAKTREDGSAAIMSVGAEANSLPNPERLAIGADNKGASTTLKT